MSGLLVCICGLEEFGKGIVMVTVMGHDMEKGVQDGSRGMGYEGIICMVEFSFLGCTAWKGEGISVHTTALYL